MPTYGKQEVCGPDGGPIPVTIPSAGGFAAPPTADYAGLTYSGNNVTAIVYRQGGVNGGVVGTLNMTYNDSGNVTAIYWS